MINVVCGYVKELVKRKDGISYFLVDVEKKDIYALCFEKIVGSPKIGDKVVINTTAYDMQLGSGAYAMIMGILSASKKHKREDGHIIKLRYTPYQFPVRCVEEQGSEYQKHLKKFVSLEKIPVIVGMLLSQAAAACCILKHLAEKKKIAYIMIDTSSLSLQVSDVIYMLKKEKYIDWTITCGQAYGGDYEAVNLYSALAFAKEVLKADVVVVSPGVGGVGTNTKYGFSSISQGEVINAVNILSGRPFAILRISFADKRKRHYGLSHHSITVLSEIAITPAVLCVPEMDTEKNKLVERQIKANNIHKKHKIVKVDADASLDILSYSGIEITTMGRKPEEDKTMFLSAGATAIKVAEEIKEK